MLQLGDRRQPHGAGAVVQRRLQRLETRRAASSAPAPRRSRTSRLLMHDAGRRSTSVIRRGGSPLSTVMADSRRDGSAVSAISARAAALPCSSSRMPTRARASRAADTTSGARSTAASHCRICGTRVSRRRASASTAARRLHGSGARDACSRMARASSRSTFPNAADGGARDVLVGRSRQRFEYRQRLCRRHPSDDFDGRQPHVRRGILVRAWRATAGAATGSPIVPTDRSATKRTHGSGSCIAATSASILDGCSTRASADAAAARTGAESCASVHAQRVEDAGILEEGQLLDRRAAHGLVVVATAGQHVIQAIGIAEVSGDLQRRLAHDRIWSP